MRAYLRENETIVVQTDEQLEKAWTYVRDRIDLAGKTVTINLLSSPDQFTVRGALTGYGTVRIRGAGGYPGMTSRGGFYVCDGARVRFENMTIEPPQAGSDGISLSEGVVEVSGIWLGGNGLAAMHAVGNRSKIRGDGLGVTKLHDSRYNLIWNAENGANIELPCPLVCSGSPKWNVYAQADGVSCIDFTGATITKAAEQGNSAASYDCSMIRMNGKPASWLPGNGKLIRKDYGVINADQNYT